MGRIYFGAKAKAAREKRKVIESGVIHAVSDKADSVDQPDPWGRDTQYTKLSNAKTKADKHLCEHCNWRPPKRSMLHAHHIIPQICGGSNDASNLIILCPNCHAIAHFVTAISKLQRKYTGPATAVELREWMRLAYDHEGLRKKQRAHMVRAIHPIIESLRPVLAPHFPA